MRSREEGWRAVLSRAAPHLEKNDGTESIQNYHSCGTTLITRSFDESCRAVLSRAALHLNNNGKHHYS